MNTNNYELRNVRGHYEVFCNGEFLFSADSVSEAKKEIEMEEQI